MQATRMHTGYNMIQADMDGSSGNSIGYDDCLMTIWELLSVITILSNQVQKYVMSNVTMVAAASSMNVGPYSDLVALETSSTNIGVYSDLLVPVYWVWCRWPAAWTPIFLFLVLWLNSKRERFLDLNGFCVTHLKLEYLMKGKTHNQDDTQSWMQQLMGPLADFKWYRWKISW